MTEKFSKRNWIILLIFGLAGQIAWSVENMYFNVFVFDTIARDLDAITLMVQLSGVVATVVTLIAGTLSDKLGNRRAFISIGYIIWGVTVALFGFLSDETVGALFNLDPATAVSVTLVLVIAGDCIMTLFGSTANDAAFNAWLTDNTRASFRGKVEGVVAILPLLAMLIVAGGFGILVGALGYSTVFLVLGIVISICGVVGLFLIRDSERLVKNGGFRDILYGFRPSVVRENAPLYLTFLIVCVYGIACQIFMPYLIIYMTEYLRFSVIEYSVVFGGAILIGGGINVVLGGMSDKREKSRLLYLAVTVMSIGLFAMYMARGMSHFADLVFFALSGLAMITGYIFVAQLTGSIMRDYTPAADTGKLQGVRMVFSVLIPMLLGPMIGNGINAARGNLMEGDIGSTAMTTSYIPAPEIFLAAAVTCALTVFLVLALRRTIAKRGELRED